jgi:hypothetical protein
MPRLLLVLPFLIVLPGYAQNAAQPDRVIQQAVASIARAALDATAPRIAVPSKLSSNAPKATPYCSVPLLEMGIPKNHDFVMKALPPPVGFRDNMPIGQTLPPCAARP